MDWNFRDIGWSRIENGSHEFPWPTLHPVEEIRNTRPGDEAVDFGSGGGEVRREFMIRLTLQEQEPRYV